MQQRESEERSASVLNGDLIRLAGVEKWKKEREREADRVNSPFSPSPSITTDREVMRSSADPPQQQQLNFSPRSSGRHGERATAERPRRMSTPTCAHLTPRTTARLMTGRRFRWVRREPAVGAGVKHPARRRRILLLFGSPSRSAEWVLFERGEGG